MEIIDFATSNGVNMLDTAPLYGEGLSEEIIGEFFRSRKKREDVLVATKLGLSKKGSTWVSNLGRERMSQELDESRKRLSRDYIDLYQIHYPDPDVSMAKVAETMYAFYRKGLIRAIGASNFNLSQIKKFMKYSPLHVLQPQFNMFDREIEHEIVPYCVKNNIAIISYAPLNVGLLSGGFLLKGSELSQESVKRISRIELTGPRSSINRDCLASLSEISKKYGKNLTQLVINWTFSQKGITSCIVGMKDVDQAEEDLRSMGWSISKEDMEAIDRILAERENKVRPSPIRRMAVKIAGMVKRFSHRCG